MRRLPWAETPRPSAALPFDTGVWPQVGAVLEHRTGTVTEDDLAGSHLWNLQGSAVLIAPRHALTIRHVTTASLALDPDKPLSLRGIAVFFPAVGIVQVDHGLVNEENRDRLLLLQLKDSVPLPPIPAFGVEAAAEVNDPDAVGFGHWMPAGDGVYPEGVQRRLQPALLGAGHCTHDLCWNGDADGSFEAGPNNSGGAIIGRSPDHRTVAGILRRVRHDIATLPGKAVVAASKVSRNRGGWLYRVVYGPFGTVQAPSTPPPVVWLDRDPDPVVRPDRSFVSAPIKVPGDTTAVHATLSAARTWAGECLLQMHLLPDAPSPLPPQAVAATAADYHTVGEFLTRSKDLAGAATFTVVVAAVTPLAGQVRVQVALRFVDDRGEMRS